MINMVDKVNVINNPMDHRYVIMTLAIRNSPTETTINLIFDWLDPTVAHKIPILVHVCISDIEVYLTSYCFFLK